MYYFSSYQKKKKHFSYLNNNKFHIVCDLVFWGFALDKKAMRPTYMACILWILLASQNSYTQVQVFDTARIYKAMNKGRNGQDLKIGVIGGSITAGYAASSESNRWSNIMADWWKTTFPGSEVELINAGWGGTGSDIGVHRIYDDLLMKQPDFIVVEFSVNDAESELATKMMEGLAQQVLIAENTPGLMLLLLKQANGTTAAESHKPVAAHYHIPYVSFADLIDDALAEDETELDSIFVDGLHPNDLGMAYIAGFITDMLDSIYINLPAEDQLLEISTDLPAPLNTTVYSNTIQYFPDVVVPFSNEGWQVTESGWSSANVDSQIEFKVTGNSVSLIYTQNCFTNRGRAEIWVDDHEKTIIDAYMPDDWGTKYAFALVQEGFVDGEHTLHINVLSESSTGGNYVHIERIMTAGNVGSIPPIAKTGSKQKGVIGQLIALDGSGSFDPDGDTIQTYSWTFKEKPVGSSALITNSGDSMASFIPDVAGNYLIELVVSEGINNSIPAAKKVEIRETNSKPVAIPGNDTVSAINKYFWFDGSKSYDNDGDNISFNWILESLPNKSKANIIQPESDNPQCKLDKEGDYVVSLTVYDSIEYSDKAYITVEGREGYSYIKQLNRNLEWVKAYPNPTTGEISIQYYLQHAEAVMVKLFNLQSKLIANYNYSCNITGLNEQSMDLTLLHLKPGVYFLKLISNDSSETVKIIFNPINTSLADRRIIYQSI